MPLSRFVEKPRSKSCTRWLPIRVNTMDAELNFEEVEIRATGRDLLDLTCRTLGLRETWFFGLQYIDTGGDVQWLRESKKILDQDLPKDSLRCCSLMVKFFPEDISEIIQELTRHMFFLQVKHSILNADIYCPPEATVLLASYAVQAKYGDYDEKTYKPEMLATEDLLPQRVIDQYQMTPDMWAEKIKVWYEAIRGMPSEEAEMEYLKIAQDLEMYGITYFSIKNKRNCDLWLGVSSLGLFVFDQDNRLTAKVSFPWAEIKDISYNNKKFAIKMIDKKSPDFVFNVQKLKTNKMILDLCVGNHEMFIKRRRPDSMEVQQMKTQALEERARKLMERELLEKEKLLREEAQREKLELQQHVCELQDQFRQAQEAVVCSEEAADLLAEKVRGMEETSSLLSRKAAEYEAEKQRMQLAAMKTEEEKLFMERRAREAEILAGQIVEECDRRNQEARQLRAELVAAKLAERAAREKYQDFMRTSSLYGSVASVASVPGYSCSATDYITARSADLVDNAATASSLAFGEHLPSSDVNNVLCEIDKDKLNREIEMERVHYLQQSQNLEEQLKTIKSEIDNLKVEEKQSHLDNIHEHNLLQGTTKYSALGRGKSGPAKARIQFYEDL